MTQQDNCIMNSLTKRDHSGSDWVRAEYFTEIHSWMLRLSLIIKTLKKEDVNVLKMYSDTMSTCVEESCSGENIWLD